MTETISGPQVLARGIADAIGKLSRTEKRCLIAVAGPPGAGKSTVAGHVKAILDIEGNPAGLLPMDGFHLDNAILSARGLLDRKGAPETFDVAGFQAMLGRLMTEDEVAVPTFDRSLDKAIAASAMVTADQRIVIVEGNYLLLSEPPWDACAPFWSLGVLLDVPMQELETRLVQRWLDHGLDPAAARKRAEGNDLPNARRVLAQSANIDLRLR